MKLPKDFASALILAFSQREKESLLIFSPLGRDGREAPVRAIGRKTG
jgi:hypothetical protein